MKAVVLAMAVGGLGGLWLGERERPAPDPWLGEALLSLDRRDFDRALIAVEHRLDVAPDDALARLLRERALAEADCRDLMAEGEHALVNHDRARAASAYRRVPPTCRLHPFAVLRLEQTHPR